MPSVDDLIWSLFSNPENTPNEKYSLEGFAPRRAFFSFHFDDVMRVNNVRRAFEFFNPRYAFQDGSLWEARKLESDDSVKRVIRDGVHNTSVVCVLVGSDTYQRRWVRYEIARSVVAEKGLLAVHLNGLNHHKYLGPTPLGPNPLDYMAVGRSEDGSYRLFEWDRRWNGYSPQWGFYPYTDYQEAVALPMYLPAPLPLHVVPLSWGTATYDFARENGSELIGAWIDHAAQRAGR